MKSVCQWAYNLGYYQCPIYSSKWSLIVMIYYGKYEASLRTRHGAYKKWSQTKDPLCKQTIQDQEKWLRRRTTGKELSPGDRNCDGKTILSVRATLHSFMHWTEHCLVAFVFADSRGGGNVSICPVKSQVCMTIYRLSGKHFVLNQVIGSHLHGCTTWVKYTCPPIEEKNQ